MTPEFPLRIIRDDGECIVVGSPEDLLNEIDTLDSTDPSACVWVRDALDRTVRVRLRQGFMELLEI